MSLHSVWKLAHVSVHAGILCLVEGGIVDGCAPPSTSGMLYEGSGTTVVAGLGFFLPPNCTMTVPHSASHLYMSTRHKM